MKFVNNARVDGNLGDTPTQRDLPSGAIVLNFSVATTKYWKKKGDSEWSERTDWHNVEVFGRLAEDCLSLVKGSLVSVEGELITDKVPGKDGGPDRYFTKIRASSVNEIVRRPSNRSSSADQSGQPDMSAHQEFIDAMDKEGFRA